MIDILGLKGVEAVIFDKDGTLTDVHPYWARIIELRAKAVIEYYDLPRSKFYALVDCMGLDTKTGRLKPEGPIAIVSRGIVIQHVITLLNKWGLNAMVPDIEAVFNIAQKEFEKNISQYIEILPGVRAFLTKLKEAGVRMVVVTSDSVHSAASVLAYLDLSGFFKYIIGRESCTESKETGIPCKKAIEFAEFNPSTTITIGDAPVDLIMAQKNNLLGSIGVTTGQISKEVLLQYTPYVVNSMEDLI